MKKLSKETQDLIMEEFFGTHKRTWEEKTDEERIYEVQFGIHQTAFYNFFGKNHGLLHGLVFKNGEPDDLYLNSLFARVVTEFRNELETIELTEHDIKCMISAIEPKLYKEEIIG